MWSRGRAACIKAIAGPRKLDSKLAEGEEVIACGGRAEIAEDEVLGHEVVKLSHGLLLVKEKKKDFTRK